MIHKVKKDLNFGQTIQYLQEGKLMARKGWNGKNMFLWLKQGFEIKTEFCKDPILKSLCENNDGSIIGLPTICMKTADNKVMTGWVPTQTDMFAEDWFIVEY